MKLWVYGRKIEILRSNDKWSVFYLGNEGKKRTAHDIVIPPELEKGEIKNYLEDLLHEWATPSNNQIIEI
ncbi:MAG: hypothetical protein ACI8ZB_003300 [Desulforhopalus sp.]